MEEKLFCTWTENISKQTSNLCKIDDILTFSQGEWNKTKNVKRK